MAHTLDWLERIGYDINPYLYDKKIEWKGTYAKVTDEPKQIK